MTKDDMRITFSMSGGFAHLPGLSRPVTIDLSELSAEEAQELQELLQGIDFGGLRKVGAKPRSGAADYRTYKIAVEEGNRTRSITLTDPVEDSKLQRLIAILRGKGRQAGAAT